MQNLGIKSLRVNKTCNILLGLFSPYKFEMKEYKGYNITRFKDNIRFLEVLVHRDGEMGGLCPLFFDGAVSRFEELPLPDDEAQLKRIYAYMDMLRNPHPVSNKLFFMFNSIRKFLNI